MVFNRPHLKVYDIHVHRCSSLQAYMNYSTSSCHRLSKYCYFGLLKHNSGADITTLCFISETDLPLSSCNSPLFFSLYRLWIRTICCRTRGPTTSLLRFSRQTCTPPRTTPQGWANMTTAQTPRPLPVEPITTAEARAPSVALRPLWTSPPKILHFSHPHTLHPMRCLFQHSSWFFPKLSSLRTVSPKSCLVVSDGGKVQWFKQHFLKIV